LADATGFWLQTFARRCGVHLALVALALQLALSFGHIHRHDMIGSSFAYSKSKVVGGWETSPSVEVRKQPPSGAVDDDEHCLICFSSLVLSSSSFISAGPHHSPSSDFNDIDRSFDRSFDIVFGADRRPFQSRAPPIG
jgi:hypothetical protein